MSSNPAGLAGTKRRYLEAALRGDSERALQVVEEGLQKGWEALRLHQEVMTEAGVEVGLMWLRGEIDTAQEHLVTQINLKLMERLRGNLRPTLHRSLRVVVACVAGNLHGVGPRVVADYFYRDGWDVDFLGENNPTADLVGFAAGRAANLVAISIALEDQAPSAVQAIDDLHSLPTPPRVILGGPLVVRQPGMSSEVGADGEAADALAAVREAHRLFKISQKPLNLEEFLDSLGLRVQGYRKKLGWNQERLAQASGLDRTYISAVENGKQNITLGALIKLADGLNVGVECLLGSQGLAPGESGSQRDSLTRREN